MADESSSAPAEAPAASEIDLSSEWDDAITVEAEAPAAETADSEVASHGSHETEESTKAIETVDEIRFYISHGMPAQAMAALAKLQTLTNDQAQLDALRAEVEASIQPAEEETAAEPAMEELTAGDIPTLEVEMEEAPVEEVYEPPVAAAHAIEVPAADFPVVDEAPVVVQPPVADPEPVVAQVPTPAQPAAVIEQPAAEPAVLKEFVSDLETSLGDGFQPDAAAKKPTPAAPPATPARPAAHAEPAVAAEASVPVLGEFVADIEASLGEDFLKGAPVASLEPAPLAPIAPVAKAAPKPAAPAPVVAAPVVAPPIVTPAAVAPRVEAPRVAPPMAASAAASAAPQAGPHSAPAMSSSAAATGSVAWQAPPITVPKPQPPASLTSNAPATRGAAKASPFGDDAGVDLAEMFGELKHDLEADVASADEDPETHYNLGIAFREMGLLDEAIGELQKACQSVDRGKPFPQIMQTYTWLAQCFLEKGVPQAAVRWYDKALNVPGIDGETRVALHYELASAYESAGDKPSALHHFMDVYGSNIDYRDVAERIKALKS